MNEKLDVFKKLLNRMSEEKKIELINSSFPPFDMLEVLSEDDSPYVREKVLFNPNTPSLVVEKLRIEWDDDKERILNMNENNYIPFD